MKQTKISIIALSLLLFGNATSCLSDSNTQRRSLKRGKAIGSLKTTKSTIKTSNPGVIPIVPPIPPTDTDFDDGNNIPDDNDNTDTSVSDTIIDKEKIAKNARIRDIRTKYQTFLNDAQLNCIGIGDKLKLIQNLSTGTTVISATGTLATGGAFVSEMVGENDARQGLETGLLVGGALTSTGGVITSAVALSNMDKLISKMKDCKGNISNIKNIEQELLDEDVDESDKTIMQVREISSKCGGIDDNSVKNVESIKGMLVGSTITSGIGAGASVVATVTNAKTSSETDNEKKNKLNIATKISTGVSTAAQGVSLILGAKTINKVNKDKDTADDCEETLMKY